MEITRTLGTYSQMYWLLYLLTAVAGLFCALGVQRQVRRWRRGQGRLRDRLDHPLHRLLALGIDLLAQRRFRRSHHSWHFHAFIVWGFALFFLATLCVLLQEHFGLPTFRGVWYLGLKLCLDLFALLVLTGVVFAAWRRWLKPPLELSRSPGSALPLVLIALLPVTGLLLEGVRLARDGDRWAVWSPVGYGVAAFFSGLTPHTFSTLHQGLWWGHLAIALAFLAAIPYTRLFHLASGTSALFFVDRQAAAALIPLDFSDAEATSYGVGRINDFHWKRLLDADACTGCGRCQTQCPAWLTDKPLSPKELGETLSTQLSQAERARNGTSPLIAGNTVADEALWACTTCRACEVQCPMAIEHVPRLVDLRRYLVLTESRFPEELQTAFRGLERRGNPWGLESRKYAAEANLPTLNDVPGAEILLWPGCSGRYDPRYRQVIAALSALLKEAGISFAVLEDEVVCCGDGARRLGNEYLFQKLARRNIDALKPYGISHIVTPCPHCLNALGNEYPQFGGHFTVVHHSVLLRDLLAEGRLCPTDAKLSPAAFHDPCYLGRYAGEFAAPRAALMASTDSLVEFEKCGEESFCCGGGGGRIWLEEGVGKSMAEERIRQLLQTPVSVLATACPFCLAMLSEGTKRLNASIQVRDLSEILAENLKLNRKGESV